MGEETSFRDRLYAWWMAARVHTLPAGISPVLVGIGIAAADEVFSLWPALAALVGAVLIQIGTNFANDYSDAIKGTDAPDRTGFTRVTAAGLLEASTVRLAAFTTFGLAILLGTYLVYIGGLPIAIIGLSSVLFGYLYTGGPKPYGYRGLGDLFVFVYFGLVAVVGTYYVQAADVLASPLTVAIPAGTITLEAILGGIAMGALTTAILVVNNYRDIEEDTAAGKRTLAVMLGPRWTRVEFIALLAVAYLVPIYFVFEGYELVLFVYATLPVGAYAIRTMLIIQEGETLNQLLSNVGRLTLLYAILFAVGVWW